MAEAQTRSAISVFRYYCSNQRRWPPLSINFLQKFTSDLKLESAATPAKMAGISDDEILSSFASGTIELYVGPIGKIYHVHETLLTKYEWFRKRMPPYGNDSASRYSISLFKEEPKIIELLILWLYRKTLKAISTTDEEVAKREVVLYVSLYLRACDWKILELQNALMDKLRLRKTCEHGYFPRKLIKKIYESTESPSPLRSYIVDSFIHKGSKWNRDTGPADPTRQYILTRKRALKNQLDAGNQKFVLDCYEALFQLCAKSRIRDPDRKTGCVYHRHKKGEKCWM